MSTLQATGPGPAPTALRFRASLDGHRALGSFGPNWFACVMGTGIVANAAATLPVSPPGLDVAARAVWLLAALVLLVVGAATAAHWVRHPATARGHLDDPVLGHFYGAPAMALTTVGTGALLVGVPVVGEGAAVGIDAVLWTAGALLGLATAVVVPWRAYAAVRAGRSGPRAAFGGWLMPVVPPMVSAATGPLLVPHLPAGTWRAALLLACTAMFALSLLAALVVIALVGRRMLHHGVGAAAGVPTLWIVLGPLGQSVTAAHTMGVGAAGVLPAPYAAAYRALGPAYGVPVWGAALLWLAVVGTLTVRTARRGLPFTLAWWSFTFPVGTVVTGTSALAAATGARPFVVLAPVLYAGLVAAWAVVATRTARGAWTGVLLRGAH